MADFFLCLVNMSISAGWLILAILLLRLLLKSAPKWMRICLWGMVAIRLACPFSLESALSLLPTGETVSPEIVTQAVPHIDTGVPVLNEAVNPIISGTFAPDPTASVNPLQVWLPIAGYIWLLGWAVLMLHTALSYLRLKRRVSTAVRLKDNIYQSENIASPFVFGVIRPNIYLPFGGLEGETDYVIAHEQAHIRRKDHLWKPLGFLLLTLHWFNPLVWVGYILLCRDIELACDEKVIRELTNRQKADYAQALLVCSVHRPGLRACPLAFGEVAVKKRIKMILHYKKPVFWVILIAVLVATATAVFFLTDPIPVGKNQLLFQVLGGEKAFYTQAGEKVYLKDYTLGGGAKVSTEPQKYAFADFDGDGTDEMVLYASPDYGAYLVFHTYRGRVYGFEFEEKALSQLKRDGSFVQVEGNGVSRYMTMGFEKSSCVLTELAYKNDTLQNTDPAAFRIGGKTVTGEEMYDFTTKFGKKTGLQWFSVGESSAVDAISLYTEFLKGKKLARENTFVRRSVDAYWSTVSCASCGYAFYDVTGDGVPELYLHDYRSSSVHIFTVKNGQIHRWHSLMPNSNLSTALYFLTDGGIMSTAGSYYEGYLVTEYTLLDPNAAVKFRITYGWYDGNKNKTPDENDRFEVNGSRTTKAEYDRVAQKYGDIDNYGLQWRYMDRQASN